MCGRGVKKIEKKDKIFFGGGGGWGRCTFDRSKTPTTYALA